MCGSHRLRGLVGLGVVLAAMAACSAATPTSEVVSAVEVAASPTSILGATDIPTNPPATNVIGGVIPQPTIPPPPATPIPTVPGTTEGQGCTLDSDFVTDVTIPDRTHIQPGESFLKTWRIRNSGTCLWDPSYRFVQIAGTTLSADPLSIAMPEVAAGDETEITMSLDLAATAAPDSEHRAAFQIQAPDGTFFGAKPFVLIVADVSAPGTSASISGVVFGDFCHPANIEGSGNPQEGSCVPSATGGVKADGVRQGVENGLAGIYVDLSQGVCPGVSVIATNVTDANGEFGFPGLAPGAYCVSIDAVSVYNIAALIPGGWTAPDSGSEPVAHRQFTLEAGEKINDVLFGWDRQLD